MVSNKILLQSGHTVSLYYCNLNAAFDLHNIAKYCEKLTDNLCLRGRLARTRMGDIKMKGSAHYSGLLPVVRPTVLENDLFADGRRSLRRRAPRALSHSLIAFCAGVTATSAWWSYGDAARQMIANRHPRLGWLAQQAEPVAQSAPKVIAPAAQATTSFDQQQLSAMSLNLDAVRQSTDRLAATQEQMTRSIEQIATRIAAGQEQMMRSIGQIAINIAASQEQMTRRTDQPATIGQAPSANASGVAVESRDDAASLVSTARLNMTPIEAKPPEKQLSAASAHDHSCFPSAAAVLQNHPGGSPSWTLKAPGHEGTTCWYASARPRARDNRREMMPGKEVLGTTDNGLSVPPAQSYSRPPE